MSGDGEQFARFPLRFDSARQDDAQLVAVKVGIEKGTRQGMNPNHGLPFPQSDRTVRDNRRGIDRWLPIDQNGRFRHHGIERLIVALVRQEGSDDELPPSTGGSNGFSCRRKTVRRWFEAKFAATRKSYAFTGPRPS